MSFFYNTFFSPVIQPIYAKILFVLMHVVGLLCLHREDTRPFFEPLIAFNLLTNVAILIYFHHFTEKKNDKEIDKEINEKIILTSKYETNFLIFLLISFFTGYFIEVLGVHTRLIFGEYWYVRNMGIKILSVPLLIGANWFMLAYCAGILGEYLGNFFSKISNVRIFSISFSNIFFKAFLGAFLMTFLDYWIEPFAIEFNMWAWKDGVIPLQNYIGWFFTSYFLMLVFYVLSFYKKNPLAIFLFVCQFLFFVGHYCMVIL